MNLREIEIVPLVIGTGEQGIETIVSSGEIRSFFLFNLGSLWRIGL